MFFDSILNFFKKFFGKDANTVQKVVTGVNELFMKAQPIVAAFAMAVTAADMVNPSVATKKILSVLSFYVKQESMVQAFIQKNEGLDLGSFIFNAASLALSHTAGVGVLKDIQLAVQLAYNVYAVLHPTTTGKTSVIATVSA
jgi:hypothetical protein